MSIEENKKIKVFLAINYKLVLESIKEILHDELDFEIVGLTNNVLDLINDIEALEIDVLVVDHDLENLDMKKISELNKNNSNANLILLIDHKIEQEKLVEYIKLGVKGYYYKENQLEQFLKSLRVISEGEMWVERKLLPQIIDDSNKPAKDRDGEDLPLYNLTPAEFRILKLVLKGLSNQKIAEALSISDKTVKFHLYKIFKKLSVKTRSQLIIFGYKNGLVS